MDPNFAPAFSGLSDAYLWAGYNEGVLTSAEAKPKAKAAAEKAIQLDDDSAEAHTSLAVFKVFYEYDWEGSEREFRRAFALNPNYAFAHDQFGLGLAFQGRLDEAIAEGKRAAELDPLSPQIPLDNLMGLAWKGKYQAAMQEAKRAADLDPAFFFPQWGYGWVDIQAGKTAAAIPAFQKAKAMESPAFITAWLGYAYGASGDRLHALAQIEDLKKTSLMVMFCRSTWRLCIWGWAIGSVPWDIWNRLTTPAPNGWGGLKGIVYSIRCGRSRALLR